MHSHGQRVFIKLHLFNTKPVCGTRLVCVIHFLRTDSAGIESGSAADLSVECVCVCGCFSMQSFGVGGAGG